MNRYTVLEAQLSSFILYCLWRKHEVLFEFCRSDYFCYKDFPYEERMFFIENSCITPEDLLEEILD